MSDHTPEQAARRTCPLCKGIGASVEVDALHPDGRVENPQPAVCMVCEGEGTVGADANAPTPERAMILSAYYDQTTALCDLVYGTEGDAPDGAAEFHVELNAALADAYEDGNGDLVERLNAERTARQEAERERDEAWAEMDAVHSFLSLRGVTPTDHYRHAGAHGSMMPRVREALAASDAALADVACAAGECLVPIPEPGSDIARVMLANVAMRRERDEARAALAKEEHAHGITIDQRENAQSWADSLANQIAALADHEIGEHSNLNNPWDNAQDGLQKLQCQLTDLRNSRPINVPALAARLQSVREMARDAATTAMARAIEDIIYDMLPRPTGTEGLIEK